jgi:hypothetical protein
LNHRVPISSEVAAMIKLQIEETRKKSTEESNPQHLLFVQFTGKRKGRSPAPSNVSKALNRLAEKYQIKNSEGKVFWFKNHAFRHTRAIELINNGMPLIYVQKWLAHASPEMTLRYAKILDSTIRRKWEEIEESKLFRVDINTGEFHVVELTSEENNELIEWSRIRKNLDAVRLEHGYCFKPSKLHCKRQKDPCLECNYFCTTKDFISQYEKTKSDLLEQIERGKLLGREVWVETNAMFLQRIDEVLNLLKDSNLYQPGGRDVREYT